MSSSNNRDISKHDRARAADDATRDVEVPKEPVAPTVDLNFTRCLDDLPEEGKHTDFEFDEDAKDEDSEEGLIGRQFGDYTIIDSIGRGGMGQVFLAHHRMMDRKVALKILPDDFANDTEMVNRFFLEVKSLGKLLHPNIVTAFDAGQSDGLYFLVMELIEGQSLSQYITDNGPCTVEKAIDIVRQAALALAYAHDRGLIHRDIKPSNLMLTEDGTIKVLDFGLVRLAGLETDQAAERKRRVVGTVEFMSPEQIRSAATIDHRTDLYSLGATLFFLLTGQTMFAGEPMQVVVSHLNEPPPLLFELRSDIDLRVDGMFQKMVAKNPEERFASARDLLRFIETNNLQRGFHGSGAATMPIAQQLSKKLNESPTAGFGKSLTASRELGVVGIDLGMHQTQAAGVDSAHKVSAIKLEGNSEILQNILWANPKRVLFGKAAEAARNQDSNGAFQGFQRWVGLQKFEVDFCGRKCPPEIVFAAFLHHVAQVARHSVRSLSHAVVTIPSSYDQLRRVSLITCCRIAGIEVLQLLDKHLAAALARITPRDDAASGHTPDRDAGKFGGDSVRNFLVVTLTGSASEVAVVRAEGRKVQTLASAGDWQISLRRWKDRLADHLSTEIYQKTKRNIRDDVAARTRVKRVAERVLQSLGDNEVVDVKLKVYGMDFQWQITPERLIAICRAEFQAFVQFVRVAVERSGIEMGEIDEVLLVGKLLTCKSMKSTLSELMGRSVADTYVSQSDLARGAALQGNYLLPPGNPNGPHAVGVSSTDIGIVLQAKKQMLHEPRMLSRRGSPIPSNQSRALRFDRPDVKDLTLQFVERLRVDDKEWNRISSVVIGERFPNLEPNDPLQVRTHLNQSGIWTASLVDITRSASYTLPPVANYDFDDEAILDWQQWLETALLCNL